MIRKPGRLQIGAQSRIQMSKSCKFRSMQRGGVRRLFVSAERSEESVGVNADPGYGDYSETTTRASIAGVVVVLSRQLRFEKVECTSAEFGLVGNNNWSFLAQLECSVVVEWCRCGATPTFLRNGDSFFFPFQPEGRSMARSKQLQTGKAVRLKLERQ
ncbi:hypothetical protein IF2G_01670 [Cordyceps javanica]|nr:hypothetical protein IF2G_01670 [Cordyceps javanica]